jgi:protein-S-isoprenylcysteine O-methyltransferase Ste14
MFQRLAARVTVQSAALVALIAFLLLAPAGSVLYWQAWAYVGIFLIATTSISAYLLRKDPALLERRLALGEKGERRPRQKAVQATLGVAFFAMLVVSSLDLRFGWSHVPFVVVVVADVVVALAFFFVFLVLRENTFAAAVVTVAAQQKVVTTGPYRVIRHPMYSGGLILLAATPVALGSWWAELLVVPMAVGIVLRLLDEERLLAESLDGYRAYMAATRSRLIPGVW